MRARPSARSLLVSCLVGRGRGGDRGSLLGAYGRAGWDRIIDRAVVASGARGSQCRSEMTHVGTLTDGEERLCENSRKAKGKREM